MGTDRPANEDLRWMLTDAKWLYHLGSKRGCLLMLLCAVDALARRAHPQLSGRGNVAKRFCRYLRKHLVTYPLITSEFTVDVPGKGGLKLEDVLYKYLRGALVHEGSKLSLDESPEQPVVIDWQDPRVILNGSHQGKLVLGGDWIINAVERMVEAAIEGRLLPEVDDRDNLDRSNDAT